MKTVTWNNSIGVTRVFERSYSLVRYSLNIGTFGQMMTVNRMNKSKACFIYNIVLVFLTVFSGKPGFSQTDTLFLFSDCILIGDSLFNQTVDGKKSGTWVEYEIKQSRVVKLMHYQWSGFDSLGNDVHGTKNYTLKYKGLSDFESMKTISPIVKENHSDFSISQNYIPPEVYFITSIGKYLQDKKEGIWKYYHEGGTPKKTINFKNGRPSKAFTIFTEDGTRLMTLAPASNNHWEVCKFSRSKSKPRCKIHPYNEIHFLFD